MSRTNLNQKTKSEGWKMGKKEREIIKQFETMKSEIMGKITGLKEQKK